MRCIRDGVGILKQTQVLSKQPVRDKHRARRILRIRLRRLRTAHDDVGRTECCDVSQRCALIPLADGDNNNDRSNAKNDAEACERRTQLVKPEIVQAELDDFEEESRLHARYQHCAAQSALQSRW